MELIAVGTIAVSIAACVLVVARSAAEAAEETARRLRARERARLAREAPVTHVSRERDLHRSGLKRSSRRTRGGG